MPLLYFTLLYDRAANKATTHQRCVLSLATFSAEKNPKQPKLSACYCTHDKFNSRKCKSCIVIMAGLMHGVTVSDFHDVFNDILWHFSTFSMNEI